MAARNHDLLSICDASPSGGRETDRAQGSGATWTVMAALRVRRYLQRAVKPFTWRWMMMAQRLMSSVRSLSSDAICPARRNTLVSPSWYPCAPPPTAVTHQSA